MITEREYQILHLIAHEYTVCQMAQDLFISPETVKTHKKSLFRKMEVRNIAGLVRRGFEEGMLIVGAQSREQLNGAFE